MTYPVVLWRCTPLPPSMNMTGQGDAGVMCEGYRYLEPGKEAGPCGHETHSWGGHGHAGIINRCTRPMTKVGDFELREDA